jgi:long-chain acyl-CoA synthetase
MMIEPADHDTIAHFMHDLAGVYEDRVAISWKKNYRYQSFSYQEIYTQARKVVSLFHSLEIEKGDKVCVWANNSPSWVVCLLGSSMMGVIVVPIDFNSDTGFVERIVNEVEAKAILLSKYKELDTEITKLYSEDLFKRIDNINPIPLTDLPMIRADDLVEIVYTSGTTGHPKGVTLTNRNIISNCASIREWMKLESDHCFLSVLPLSHMFEQVLGLFHPLRAGATIYYVNTLNPSVISKTLKKKKITAMASVPFFLESMKEKIEREFNQKGWAWALKLLLAINKHFPHATRQLFSTALRKKSSGNLRLFICGGAALERKVEDFWEQVGIHTLLGYGLTEASPIVACNVIGQKKPHTVGKSLPGQSVRIAPDGEILISGQNVTPGYYKNEEATKASFEHEWYKTGDIGELDAEGFLTIKGRKKDMILSSAGLNIYPKDIEDVLNKLEGVKESCVMGIEQSGRTNIYAAVIFEPHWGSQIDQIVTIANERLNPNQKIKSGMIWPEPEFPKTPTLKIKKHKVGEYLKAWINNEKPISLGKIEDEDLDKKLMHRLALLLGKPSSEVSEESQLIEDLGFDSIGLVELVVRIEEWYGIDFDEENFKPGITVSQVQKLINSALISSSKFPQNNWARTSWAKLLRNWVHKPLFMYLRSIIKMEVIGKESLLQIDEPVIFVSNHTSHLDSLMIARALPAQLSNNLAVAAAADYFFGIGEGTGKARGLMQGVLPVLAPMLINAFPFSRKGAIRKSLDLMGEILDDGWSVLIYPEGTRSLTGEMGPFRSGIGLIASEMQAPILPVKVEGLYELMPKGSAFPQKGGAIVKFGRPMRFTDEENHTNISERIENEIRKM